jgi:hypothetical protein
MNTEIERLASILAAEQVRLTNAVECNDEAQQALAVLRKRHADAVGRATAALDAIRAGTLSEEVGGARHSIALQDTADLKELIEQGMSTVASRSAVVDSARRAVASAQKTLDDRERLIMVDGLKARIQEAEKRLLDLVLEVHRLNLGLNGGFASVRDAWTPSDDMLNVVKFGTAPRC